MIGFAIGMAAFLLWLLVLWGVTHLARSTPRHPFLTIRRFRSERRSMAPARPQEPADEEEPARSIEHDLLPFAAALDEGAPPVIPNTAEESIEPDDGEWESFIAAMKAPVEDTTITIPDLVTESPTPPAADKKPQPKRASSARKPTKRPAGPRRQGRMTYVLVDKDGKPDLG